MPNLMIIKKKIFGKYQRWVVVARGASRQAGSEWGTALVFLEDACHHYSICQTVVPDCWVCMIGILWSPKLSKQNYASMPVWIKSSKRHYLLATKTGNWMKLEDVALGKVPSERECLNALRERKLFIWLC
jgi:hypothetical protein